jgi:hypothetical protein
LHAGQTRGSKAGEVISKDEPLRQAPSAEINRPNNAEET